MLTKRPRYDQKPLREAIFELFAEPDTLTAWSAASIAGLATAFPEFTHHEEKLQDFGIQFQIRDGALLPKTHEPRSRIRRWDEAKKRALQFGSHMCAYNVLGPAYTQFEDQQEAIKRVMQYYADEARPSKLAWVGQRYINAITLPIDEPDVASYFPIYPTLPTSLTGHRPFAMQVQTEETKNATVVVNLSLEKTDDRQATYTLDVYARSCGDTPNDTDALAHWHEATHGAVHRAFQLSISNRCRELFKEVA